MKSLFTDKTRREKLIKTILLILAGIAILLGATFAWSDLSQHKTDLNDGKRRANERNVTLNDNAPADPGWTEGTTVTKELSVSNLEDSGGLACVRLSLKEFMELRDYQTEDFYLDDKGEKILFATFADGSARQGEYMTFAEAKQLGFKNYGSFKVPEGLNPETGEQVMVEYATTNTIELRNGIYGKPMLVQGDTHQMWGNAPRANVSHNIPSTAECDYTPFFWDKNGAEPIRKGIGSRNLREYVTLNGDPVMTLEQWSTNEGKTEVGNGQLGNVWVVDEKDGWVYWADRLAPGESTDNLLDSVTFGEHPSAHLSGITGTVKLDYFIHTDMQATDESQEEVVGVFGDVEGVTTLDELRNLPPEEQISPEKLDLLTKLVYGTHEVTFEPNLPEGVDPRKLSGMPTPNPQLVSAGNKATKPDTNPTLTFADQRYHFAFWSTNPKASPTNLTAEFAWGDPITGDVKLHAIWKQSFRFKMRIGDPNIDPSKDVTLLNFAGPSDFIVDWGAAGTNQGAGTKTGNRVKYSANLADNTVKYQYDNAVTGEVTIEIFGAMPAGMTFNGQTRLTEVLSPMLPSTRADFSRVFYACTALDALPPGLFDHNPAVTSFQDAFKGCSKLTAIPAGLFDHNPLVIKFGWAFENCTSLTTIPPGLFAKNTAVETFQSAFGNCISLTAIPAGLFEKNTAVTSFYATFYGCISVRGMVPTLWISHSGANGGACFYGLDAVDNWADVVLAGWR